MALPLNAPIDPADPVTVPLDWATQRRQRAAHGHAASRALIPRSRKSDFDKVSVPLLRNPSDFVGDWISSLQGEGGPGAGLDAADGESVPVAGGDLGGWAWAWCCGSALRSRGLRRRDRPRREGS